jgi:hypothetical protein
VAFVLRLRHSLKHELRRIAKKELERTPGELEVRPSDATIHEARKSVKKVRAILRLLADESKPGARRKDEKRLRHAGRSLALLRDADAMIQTFDDLCRRHPRLLPEHTSAIVRRHLAESKSCSTVKARQANVLARTARRLRSVERSTHDWRVPALHAHELAPAIGKAYRAGRKAMRETLERNRAADAHRWRRRAKTLWYQLRLVESLAPRVTTFVRDLKRLETLLGDDHNLHVLAAELDAIARSPLKAGIDKVIDAASADQERLRRRAFEVGQRLFAERPKRFAARIEHWLRPSRGIGRVFDPAAVA